MEKRAHVNHRGFGQLGKSSQNNLNVVGDVTGGLQRNGLGDHCISTSTESQSMIDGAQKQPGE